jgi:hypothetical protein
MRSKFDSFDFLRDCQSTRAAEDALVLTQGKVKVNFKPVGPEGCIKH